MTATHVKGTTAYVRNASGRIVDIPATQEEIYLAQGYKPVTAAEVKDTPNFQSAKEGESQIALTVSEQLAYNAQTLARMGQVDEEASTGNEPYPPMTSRTIDGFPKTSTNAAQPARQGVSPLLTRGEAPDLLHEMKGVIINSGGTGGAKLADDAEADGEVQILVSSGEAARILRVDGAPDQTPVVQPVSQVNSGATDKTVTLPDQTPVSKPAVKPQPTKTASK